MASKEDPPELRLNHLEELKAVDQESTNKKVDSEEAEASVHLGNSPTIRYDNLLMFSCIGNITISFSPLTPTISQKLT